MTLNFGLKKTWNDLIESKQRLNYLIGFGVLVVVLSLVDVFLKVKIFSSIGNLILGSYYILMMNNIINNRIPILEDLGNVESKERHLTAVVLKNIGIGLVYSFILVLIGVILFMVLKSFMLTQAQVLISLFLLFIPVFLLFPFINLLFAENLAFKDAFNIKRAIKSFIFAWKQYLAVYGIYLLAAILAFAVLFGILVPLSISIVFLLKSFPALVITRETGRLIGGIIGTVGGEILSIFLSYWYMNVMAQVYRYSLLKMNLQEIEQ